MLSRVAETVYWLSRYVERAENIARFIDVNYNLTLGKTESLSKQWTPLLETTADQNEFVKRYDSPTRENVLQFLSFDEENGNSMISCVARARENARTIREVISSVVWEQLNTFHLLVQAAGHSPKTLEQPQAFCEQVRLTSHLLVGAMDATMSHDEAWHFSRLGRMIERGDKTSRLLDVQYYNLLPDGGNVGSSLDVVRWSALLRSASALESYRRLRGKIVPQRVAEFLMLDRKFPRAMHFAAMRARDSMRVITGSELNSYCYHSEQLLGRLCSSLDYAVIDDILQDGLHEYIDQFQRQLNTIGQEIHEDFFSVDRLNASPDASVMT
ncbi:alpha-E domain-containing protein [Stieleria sp. ICT_E10.1]|uniref:alpha-E domain-containing protein n=1 Tax=Stieleria sedimenti TaxID=2976331 RepID=UPI00217FBB3B|nr:alpha-E domain-containing protein [Stieleria sedimenti]MCS7467719.1 alpha-E domain-containing protein [Stieleria sedimenti]